MILVLSYILLYFYEMGGDLKELDKCIVKYAKMCIPDWSKPGNGKDWFFPNEVDRPHIHGNSKYIGV
jgi:hypothetical protein